MQSNTFGGLEAYHQFILFIVVPNGDKTDKYPIDPVTGRRADAHDPSIWMPCHVAQALVAEGRGHGVGFVFTANDPFFFFDLDDCRQGDGWNDLATRMCQYFAGCYIEVSLSGTGLHIIGSATLPAHSKKNPRDIRATLPFGMELYHDLRFCALTGTGAQGSAHHQVQAQAEWLCANYFPPRVEVEQSEWTSGPCADWSGPEDDDELLNRMLNARGSAAGMFGMRATVNQLWEGDPATLAPYYPPEKADKVFNQSEADMGLLQHLAFWTGKDCERMDRLFRRSGLYRDKWERDDYRVDSVKLAVGRCSTVYSGGRQAMRNGEAPTPVQPLPVMGQRPAPAPASPTAAAPAPIAPAPVDVEEGSLRDTALQYLGITQQQQHFSGCVYIRECHRIFTPDGSLLKSEQFNATYGGYIFAVDLVNDKTTDKAWTAFTESRATQFPKAHDACFRPECLPGALIQEEGRTLVNTYVPVDTAPTPGDASPFLLHIAKLLPVEHDRQILLSYMAACVQYPGVKFQWMPLLQGMEGNGKTLLIRCLSHAIGHRYTHLPKADDISNKFNAWVLRRLFIGLEEIYVADRQEVIDALKPLITNDRVEIQPKGQDQTTGDNRANFMGCSNHQDCIRKTRLDRRYCVFFTAQQDAGDLERDGMDGDYFPQLYAWLKGGGYSVVNWYLRTYQIPEALNPATSCQRAPVTSTTEEAIRASLGGIEQEVMESIEEGRAGFAGGWISSVAFDRMLEIRRAARAIPPNKRRDLLRGLGYDYHPMLRDGRVSNPIPDPSAIGPAKPRLYVKQGHPALMLVSPADIARAYLDAQVGAAGTLAAVFGKGQ